MSVTGAWIYLGLFVILPLVIAGVLLLTVDAGVALVAGLIVIFTFACTGFILGPGMMVDD